MHVRRSTHSLHSHDVTGPALPPLPPRSATEIVDGAVQLIRPQYPYFLRIAAIGAIPALVLAVVTLLLAPTPSADPTVLLQQQLALLPLSLLTYIFATVQSGAIMSGALSLLRGNALPTVWSAFSEAFRRLFALIGANMLLAVSMMIVVLPVVAVFLLAGVAGAATFTALGRSGTIGTILAVILAVAFLLVVLLLAISVFARSAVMNSLVIAEKLGPIAALRRAHALSSGSYLLLAKTYALVALILGVVYAVLISIAFSFGNGQAMQAIASVILIPVMPIVGAIMLLTYADLRVRREGADLDAELNAMSAGNSVPV
jgi:hypothetical protein